MKSWRNYSQLTMPVNYFVSPARPNSLVYHNRSCFLQQFIEVNGNEKNTWTIAGIVLFSLGIKFPLETMSSYGESTITDKNLPKGLPTEDLYDKVLKVVQI